MIATNHCETVPARRIFCRHVDLKVLFIYMNQRDEKYGSDHEVYCTANNYTLGLVCVVPGRQVQRRHWLGLRDCISCIR